jgi:hypothetical protein
MNSDGKMFGDSTSSDGINSTDNDSSSDDDYAQHHMLSIVSIVLSVVSKFNALDHQSHCLLSLPLCSLRVTAKYQYADYGSSWRGIA